MDRVSLGDHLRRLRRLAGMSLAVAARNARIDRATIQKFESGKRMPDAKHLIALAAAYGIDRHLLLMYAGLVELPGFETLLGSIGEGEALDRLFENASVTERRELAKHLAWLRMTSPLLDHLFSDRAPGI